MSSLAPAQWCELHDYLFADRPSYSFSVIGLFSCGTIQLIFYPRLVDESDMWQPNSITGPRQQHMSEIFVICLFHVSHSSLFPSLTSVPMPFQRQHGSLESHDSCRLLLLLSSSMNNRCHDQQPTTGMVMSLSTYDYLSDGNTGLFVSERCIHDDLSMMGVLHLSRQLANLSESVKLIWCHAT